MNNVYLLTGANLGDRKEQLRRAMNGIAEKCGTIIDHSSLYETAAWGNTNQNDFLNQVMLIETRLGARALLNEILALENRMGRVRTARYEPRIIDIDILFFNHEIIHQHGLIVPHPELQNRRFVLEPLVEIAPALIHPQYYKTLQQLLIECPDLLAVKKL